MAGNGKLMGGISSLMCPPIHYLLTMFFPPARVIGKRRLSIPA